MSDAAILLRDMAGDAAQNAANRVNPTDEQLAQIDRPAEDNTWHDVPHISRDKLTNQLRSKVPFGKGDAQKVAGDVTQASHPTGSRDPADAADLALRDQQEGTYSGLDAGAAAGELRSQVSDNVPEEHKDKSRQQRERVRDYISSKMPKERREQTVWRLKKMVVEIQGHQDCECQQTQSLFVYKANQLSDLRAIDTLLGLAEEYTGHSKTLAAHGKGAVKGAHTDDSLQMAEADLKVFSLQILHPKPVNAD